MRGVFAKTDIKKGDDLIFVPKEALMNRDNLFESPLGK